MPRNKNQCTKFRRSTKRKPTVNLYKVSSPGQEPALIVAKTATQARTFAITEEYVITEDQITKVEKITEIPKSKIKTFPSWFSLTQLE